MVWNGNRRQPPEQPVEHGGASQHAQSQWIIHQLNEHSGHLHDHSKILGKIETSGERMAGDISDIDRRLRRLNTTILVASGVLIGIGAVVGFLLNSNLSKLMTIVEAAAKASGS